MAVQASHGTDSPALSTGAREGTRAGAAITPNINMVTTAENRNALEVGINARIHLTQPATCICPMSGATVARADFSTFLSCHGGSHRNMFCSSLGPRSSRSTGSDLVVKELNLLWQADAVLSTCTSHPAVL